MLSQKGFSQIPVLLILLAGLATALYLVGNPVRWLPKATTPDPLDTSYDINVLLIKYFPLTQDGRNIDISVTGDVGESYSVIRQRTIDVTNTLKTSLENATKYLGYKDSTAQPSLLYHIIDTREYIQAVPTKSTPIPRYPDYNGIMTSHNICNYVDNLSIKEVWLWAYQGPNKSDGYPYLSIAESKMSGPHGDISNSYRYNDMPVCRNTYRVYTFNYGRWTAEAIESWGHQTEVEMDAVDITLFRNLWQGPNYPPTLDVKGRCGSVHNPPNARSEYDRINQTPWQSDCLDWNADSLGTLSGISCQNWGCQNDNPLVDNANLNYQIWNWQNLPGRKNLKIYQDKKLRNWWDVHGDFDNVMSNNRSLTLPTPTPSPSPSPSPTPTLTPKPTKPPRFTPQPKPTKKPNTRIPRPLPSPRY